MRLSAPVRRRNSSSTFVWRILALISSLLVVEAIRSGRPGANYCFDCGHICSDNMCPNKKNGTCRARQWCPPPPQTRTTSPSAVIHSVTLTIQTITSSGVLMLTRYDDSDLDESFVLTEGFNPSWQTRRHDPFVECAIEGESIKVSIRVEQKK